MSVSTNVIQMSVFIGAGRSTVPNTIKVKQYDENAHYIVAKFYNAAGQVIDLSTLGDSRTVKLNFKAPTGTSYYYECTIDTTNNVARAMLTNDMLDVPGLAYADFTIEYTVTEDGESTTVRRSSNQFIVEIILTYYNDSATNVIANGGSPVGYDWATEDSSHVSSFSYTLVGGDEKTFKNPNGYTSATIVIPSGIVHGFYAGVVIKNTGGTLTSLSFTNNSSFTFKKVLRGSVLDTYTPVTGVIQLWFHCDGDGVYCHIGEIV